MKVYETKDIRNVGIVGHGDAGKTSLVAAILFDAGATQRLGRVDEGTTVTDYDEDEINRKITITSSLAHCEWNGAKINILDTPGYAAFILDAKAALRGADAAIVVVDAVNGVEVQTEKGWSYGEEFGNLIHHAYPGDDFYDLDSGVDAAIAKGYIDTDNLMVTGGSGGGVLTSWMVGRTTRFRAAVTVYPVINWYSFTLTSDIGNFTSKYWFPGLPWDNVEHYEKRSLLSVVKNPTPGACLRTTKAGLRNFPSFRYQRLVKATSRFAPAAGAASFI